MSICCGLDGVNWKRQFLVFDNGKKFDDFYRGFTEFFQLNHGI